MIDLKRVTFTLALLTMLSLSVVAQPDGPDAPVPFGFVELLIGAGALYGGKKAYDKRKDKTS